MWEIFLTKLAGCLLESYSQKCKVITYVILFFVAMGPLLTRVKPPKQSPCLQKYASLVVFMENHSLPLLYPSMAGSDATRRLENHPKRI